MNAIKLQDYWLQALKLKEQQYQVTFQSRFGKAEWLKPYFSEVIKKIGSEKDMRVDVLCPGFSSDCLETLEEINMEGRDIRRTWRDPKIQIYSGIE